MPKKRKAQQAALNREAAKRMLKEVLNSEKMDTDGPAEPGFDCKFENKFKFLSDVASTSTCLPVESGVFCCANADVWHTFSQTTLAELNNLSVPLEEDPDSFSLLNIGEYNLFRDTQHKRNKMIKIKQIINMAKFMKINECLFMIKYVNGQDYFFQLFFSGKSFDFAVLINWR